MFVHVVAVAVGLGAVVERSAAVFTVLKLAGAAYLVYLGIKAIRSRRSLRGVLDAATLPKRGRRLFGEGFLVGVGNPKVIIFLAAILPQFVDRNGAAPGPADARARASCSSSSPWSATASGRSPPARPATPSPRHRGGWSGWAPPAAWS